MNFRFHDLRHTFITNMRKAGVHDSVIMKPTGHKTTAMLHRYNTVDSAAARAACKKLDNFLGQEQEEESPISFSGQKSAPIVLPG